MVAVKQSWMPCNTGKRREQEMAKVRDKAGKEVEGQKMVTDRQAEHFAHFQAVRSPAPRRERALKRQTARATRSLHDQLALLNQRPGESFKERHRLLTVS